MINYKTIVAPFVALIVIVLQMFGITLPDGLEGKITTVVVDIITVVAIIYGIVKNHKREKIEVKEGE